MAKLPSKRKLLREDLKEAPAWIDKILGFVNPFFEDVYFSLNKNITLRENIDCDVREITIETTSTYSNNIPNVDAIQGEIDAIDIRIDDLETLVESLSGVPIGSTIGWDSEISLPIGFLKREGQEISRSTYDQLFAIIGTTFGAGDGSTTFNLPNSKGLVHRGMGTQVVGGNTKDGGLLGEVIEDQMQRITGRADIDAARTFGNNTGSAAGVMTITESVNASQRANSVSGGSPIAISFDSLGSPNRRVSATTDGETRASSISTIFIIRAQNLETASSTSSAIDALNARVSTNESDILAIESQLPPPISAITGLGDFIKIGQDSRNDDGTYTVSFDTPFVSGSDSDIQIVIMRKEADTSNAILATNFTKSGFNVNRSNEINGTQTISYIAINGSYL